MRLRHVTRTSAHVGESDPTKAPMGVKVDLQQNRRVTLTTFHA